MQFCQLQDPSLMEMDDDDDAIYLAALEQVEQQQAIKPKTAQLIGGGVPLHAACRAPLAQVCPQQPQQSRQALRQVEHHHPNVRASTKESTKQCGTLQRSVHGERRQATISFSRQHQDNDLAPSNAPTSECPPAARQSLLAQNKANLQHEREVQARFKAAAIAKQQERKEALRQGTSASQPVVITESSMPGGGPRALVSTQTLLCPKAPPLCVRPTFSLAPDRQGLRLTPAGLDVESAKSILIPSCGREYQRAIINSAVLSNTLVSLPTGMGKTFIAAVVMFNYLRWFPHKIVVFLAPTKPLVKQQESAVYKIVGIPPEMTMLMTGDLAPELRKSHWQTHRAFFMTPQVFENDVSNQICDANRVSLVVIDEAHKAIGQHSIVKALAYLRDRTSRNVIPDGEDSHDRRHSNHASACFRVLALTATPGTKADVVQHVITNCFISNLQVRTEQDQDVKGYLLHKDNR